MIALVGCGGGDGEEPPQVRVDSVYPVRGSSLGGTQIQLDGAGFTAGTQVQIDGLDCQALTVVNASSVTCVTPAHKAGAVDIQVSTPAGARGSVASAYTYRASGTGITSFGILATLPAQGHYPDPVSVQLESVVTGFELATARRSWVINGEKHKEGDTVLLEAGSHTVNLLVEDATGDSDSVSYVVVVGAQPESPSRVAAKPLALASPAAENPFVLNPDNSISVVNTGTLPLLNPRFIGEGRPDYVDWGRYLSSLARLADLPTDASESSRATLLEAAWKDLSTSTRHLCSPGREAENIIDPTLLVRGYGYECCSDAARALAYLGAFMDIPSRVRSTREHEFPEFTIGGKMFILDPDMRMRFWGDNQLPLSAWVSDSTPVALMNAANYTAQTPDGVFHDVYTDGFIPYGGNSAYPELSFRAFYFENIVAETIWGYHEAYSSTNYALYPNEKMAFRQTSTYSALRRLNGDGTATDNNRSPAVGKVVLRQLWSANGSRIFREAGGDKWAITLNDLPYPVQDLVFHFSKPVEPRDFQFTSGGKTYQIGDFSGHTWTVSDRQLRIFASISDLVAVIPRDQNLVVVDIGMQYNPRIFGDAATASSLIYADDSGACQRNVRVTTAGVATDIALGGSLCNATAPQRMEASHGLQKGQPGESLITSYGNSYQGTWGLAAAAGVQAFAEVSLPRTPELPGILRATNEGNFLDWEVHENGVWKPLRTTDVASTQWVKLPATSSSTTRLRVMLRQAPANDTTYLSHLSLIEGRDSGSPFAVVSAGQ